MAALGGLLMVAALIAAPGSAQAATFCAQSWPGQQKITWTGGAGTSDWATAANWSPAMVPNQVRPEQYVCIPGGATPTVGAGVRADVEAIEVATGATLTLGNGSKIFANGDQAGRPSIFHPGSTVRISAATLGGTGLIQAEGLIDWASGTGLNAATMSTRNCSLLDVNCAAGPNPGAAAPITGRLQVADNGVLDINGPAGVNLFDGYAIEVRGTMKLRGQAYVAADNGTSLSLLPKLSSGVGRWQITNNGGWLQGRLPSWAPNTLTSVSNGGLITKFGTGAGGPSVIEATYTVVGAGTVRVENGTLTLPPNVASAAFVAAGRTYGFGACSSSVYNCQPVAQPVTGSTQTATVTVPSTDTNGASLAVRTNGTPATGTIGRPVKVTPSGLSASLSNPAILKLRYDATILAGRTVTTMNVERQEDGFTTWNAVPRCDVAPTATSCIDQPASEAATAAAGDGDVVMVVRTTIFSRWRAR